MRSRAALAGLALAAATAGACTPEARRIPLDVPASHPRSREARIAEEVAHLLSDDAATSDAAARALAGLDEDGRLALAAHARRIPTERDPRFLTVLDAYGLAPDEGPRARTRLLAWQASRPDPGLVWRAQSGLLELARSHRSDVEAALLDPSTPGRDALAVALAAAGSLRSVPALVTLYRTAATTPERRAAALAIGRLEGVERQPRLDATPEERERHAERALEWYRANGGGDGAP